MNGQNPCETMILFYISGLKKYFHYIPGLNLFPLYPRVKRIIHILPGLKPCATISVMPMAFVDINFVGMTDIVIWNLFRGIKKNNGIYSVVIISNAIYSVVIISNAIYSVVIISNGFYSMALI